MTQSVPFDAYLGASKTGQAIGCIVYQLDGSTVYSAFSTAGWYESPASSGAFHHAGLTLPDAGGVVAVGVSGTEYIRSAVGAAASAVDTATIASAVWAYSKRLLTAGGVQVEEDSGTQDFGLKQGEYKQITIAVVDSSNVPVNLTGYTLDWGLWRGATRLLTKSYGSGIALVNVLGTNDGLRVTLSASDTRTLAPGTYYHECRVTNASSQPEVVAAGDVTISESKTA